MLIRSKLVRNQPGINPPVPVKTFVVEFGENRERAYEFKLDAAGDHVCDVKHPEDAQALMAIAEGYEIHPTALAALEAAGQPVPGAREKAEAKAKAEAEAKERAEKDRAAALQAIDDLDHDELVEAVAELPKARQPKKGAGDDDMRAALKAQVPE